MVEHSLVAILYVLFIHFLHELLVRSTSSQREEQYCLHIIYYGRYFIHINILGFTMVLFNANTYYNTNVQI